MFSIFKKKPFFDKEEQERIVAAIRAAERCTSGEIRVYTERRNPYMNPTDRAAELFFGLKMEQTEHRNGVLIYMATKDHELAVFGDEGIYRETGKEYWENAVADMIRAFRAEKVAEGLIGCVKTIGDTLSEKFPFVPSEDKNELPDEIIFG